MAAVVDLFSRRVGVVDERNDDGPARHRSPSDGDLASRKAPAPFCTTPFAPVSTRASSSSG